MLDEEVVPHQNDILLGRGGKNNQHQGNEQLRILARSQMERYKVSSKKGKSNISRQLVFQVRSMNPPGRFLKRNALTMSWEDVGDEVAREKASQALRDAVSTLSGSSSDQGGNDDQSLESRDGRERALSAPPATASISADTDCSEYVRAYCSSPTLGLHRKYSFVPYAAATTPYRSPSRRAPMTVSPSVVVSPDEARSAPDPTCGEDRRAGYQNRPSLGRGQSYADMHAFEPLNFSKDYERTRVYEPRSTRDHYTSTAASLQCHRHELPQHGEQHGRVRQHYDTFAGPGSGLLQAAGGTNEQPLSEDMLMAEPLGELPGDLNEDFDLFDGDLLMSGGASDSGGSSTRSKSEERLLQSRTF